MSSLYNKDGWRLICPCRPLSLVNVFLYLLFSSSSGYNVHTNNICIYTFQFIYVFNNNLSFDRVNVYWHHPTQWIVPPKWPVRYPSRHWLGHSDDSLADKFR
mmetsp:Transcript_37929/g.42752  ORF Transcript_37929/g.42752 Transcript_37929/m.42752 type:complete len:102 (+) Transcript_37929:146-451(+)